MALKMANRCRMRRRQIGCHWIIVLFRYDRQGPLRLMDSGYSPAVCLPYMCRLSAFRGTERMPLACKQQSRYKHFDDGTLLMNTWDGVQDGYCVDAVKGVLPSVGAQGRGTGPACTRCSVHLTHLACVHAYLHACMHMPFRYQSFECIASQREETRREACEPGSRRLLRDSPEELPPRCRSFSSQP